MAAAENLRVSLSDGWRETFSDARVGLLMLDDVDNPASHVALQQRVEAVEERLREKFGQADRAVLTALPAIQPYQRHYRSFGQTYHVLRQLESVALKNRPLASRGALVLAMFAVEVETLLLTAGHDLDAVRPPLVLDRSTADDNFTGIGGQEHALRSGDMIMRDADGIISSVLYGPDFRTRLHENTRRVLFTTYAPAGIAEATLRDHLEKIAEMVRVVSPAAALQLLEVY